MNFALTMATHVFWASYITHHDDYVLTIREMDRVPLWSGIATLQATPNSNTPRPPRSDNFALICLQLYLFICRTDQEKLLGARNLYHVSSSSIYTHAGSRSDF